MSLHLGLSLPEKPRELEEVWQSRVSQSGSPGGAVHPWKSGQEAAGLGGEAVEEGHVLQWWSCVGSPGLG